jgi:hypothetical protein
MQRMRNIPCYQYIFLLDELVTKYEVDPCFVLPITCWYSTYTVLFRNHIIHDSGFTYMNKSP